MKVPHCPNPEWLARVSHGDGKTGEIESLEAHAAICPECREELAALKRLGPADSWLRTRGSDHAMPEALWQNVVAARSSPLPAFQIRIGAAIGRAGRGALDAALEFAAHGTAPIRDLWVAAVSGNVQLQPLASSPVRGAPDPGDPAPTRVRAVTGDYDMLFRRGPDRLTVLITRGGAPAEGRRLVLSGAGHECASVTDSSGAAAFRDLVAGDYRLDIEGFES